MDGRVFQEKATTLFQRSNFALVICFQTGHPRLFGVVFSSTVRLQGSWNMPYLSIKEERNQARQSEEYPLKSFQSECEKVPTDSAPGGIRTRNLLIRGQTLCPIELQGRPPDSFQPSGTAATDLESAADGRNAGRRIGFYRQRRGQTRPCQIPSGRAACSVANRPAGPCAPWRPVSDTPVRPFP